MNFQKMSEKLPPFHTPFLYYREAERSANSSEHRASANCELVYLAVSLPYTKDGEIIRGITLNYVHDGDICEPSFRGDEGWWIEIPPDSPVPFLAYREKVDGNSVKKWGNNPRLFGDLIPKKNKDGYWQAVEKTDLEKD